MNMVVILVAIIGFGVSKQEWYHTYITVTALLFLSWKVDGDQCAFTDKYNTIQYYFKPVLNIDIIFILKVLVVTTLCYTSRKPKC